jgi:hypothetical protein
MITSQPRVVLTNAALEDHLLQTLETVLAQYQEWQTCRSRIHAQIAFDFQIDHPTQAEVGLALERSYLFAAALRQIALQIEGEVEDTLDRFYTWLGD